MSDLVKMCRRLSKYAHAQLSSDDLERLAARIEQLQAQLAAADALAESAHGTIHDDADTSLVAALTAYREARK